MNIFKKSPKTDTNEGNQNIRRSRGSSLSMVEHNGPYLTANKMELEKQEENKALQKEENRKKQAERQKSNERKKEPERKAREKKRAEQKESERQNLNEQRQMEPNRTSSKSGDEDEPTFEQGIEILDRHIDDLDLRSKMMATMWINRLRATPPNKEEANARDIITAHLTKCRAENIFQKEPFNMPPTSDTLSNIQQKMFLTRDTACNDMILIQRRETKYSLNKLLHDSYDGGEFLKRLPVPRDGAFFILHMRPNV